MNDASEAVHLFIVPPSSFIRPEFSDVMANLRLHDSKPDRLLGGGLCRAPLGTAMGVGRSPRR
jgi:hypothetical protein